MTQIYEIGEFGLINRITKILPEIKHKDVLLGIGDDTAAIKMDDSRALLITCDIQVENQHFQLKHISPYQLGRRAMAVNLSDIAAMGGRPTYALVSLGLPKSFPLSNFDDLYKGMRDQLSDCAAFIIGGNLSHTSNELVIDITMMGEMNIQNILTRSGARAGDRIFVTGHIGMSAAGYHVLQKYDLNYPEELQDFVNAHLQPVPKIAAGQYIAEQKEATSMIDLSDGVASDLHHICEKSSTGMEIFEAQLPVSQQLRELASLLKVPVMELVLNSGEDYELLFTLAPGASTKLINSISEAGKTRVTEIGKMLPLGTGYHFISNDGEKRLIQPKGWDHFR